MRKIAFATATIACLFHPDGVDASDVSWDSVNTYFRTTVMAPTRVRIDAKACGLNGGEKPLLRSSCKRSITRRRCGHQRSRAL